MGLQQEDNAPKTKGGATCKGKFSSSISCSARGIGGVTLHLLVGHTALVKLLSPIVAGVGIDHTCFMYLRVL